MNKTLSYERIDHKKENFWRLNNNYLNLDKVIFLGAYWTFNYDLNWKFIWKTQQIYTDEGTVLIRSFLFRSDENHKITFFLILSGWAVRLRVFWIFERFSFLVPVNRSQLDFLLVLEIINSATNTNGQQNQATQNRESQ